MALLPSHGQQAPDTPEAVAKSDKWSSLDKVVRGFVTKDVAVIMTFDLEYNFQTKLFLDDNLIGEFAALSKGTAQHYSSYPPI